MLVAVPDVLEQELRGKAQPVPNPIQVVAMIDTGASATVLQQGLASQLGLNPVGVVSINTPSSTGVQCYQFAVRLLFPNNVVVGGTVIEAPERGFAHCHVTLNWSC
jgi:hypothetical protein